jgi:hypothetical protein
MVDFPAPERPVSQSTHGFCALSPARALVDLERLPRDVGRAPQRKVDHTTGNRRVGRPVDQDECARVAILGIGIECDGAIEREIADRDLIEVEVLGRNVLERIHVDPVLELRHLRRHRRGPDLHEVGPLRQHRLLAHP